MAQYAARERSAAMNTPNTPTTFVRASGLRARCACAIALIGALASCGTAESNEPDVSEAPDVPGGSDVVTGGDTQMPGPDVSRPDVRADVTPLTDARADAPADVPIV